MVLTVLGMVAEMELGFIRDRQRAGIDAAKAKGIYKGRPASFDRARIVSQRKEGMGATEIAKAVGCKRGSVAIKPGRPIAMGSIDGVPFMGLPGNPVASFVTFVYLARAAVLALTCAVSEPFTATPVRAAFAYRKKAGRREYVRAKIRRGADGALEAVKFPREGAGLLSSLIETEGLVELPESTTLVEPGAMVAFLPYLVLF